MSNLNFELALNSAEDCAVAHTTMNRLLVAALTILVMLMLKQHYSMAAAGQLAWILSPTARMTAWLTDADLSWESGVGYADYARGIIIAPACAGINFMIMAFGLAAFCGLRQIRRLVPLLIWLSLCMAGAYSLAIVVNTLRIALSMTLYQADIYTVWITPARIHRLAGVSLYLCALGLFFKGLRPIISRYCRRFDPLERQTVKNWPSWLPLVWYLLGALGVPAANLLFHKPSPGFGEHCVTVILAGLTLWAASRLVKWLDFRGR